MSKKLYITIVEERVDWLDKTVTKYLNNDWQLYGNPYTDDTYVFQAMVMNDLTEEEFNKLLAELNY